MNDATITMTRLLADEVALNHSRLDAQAMPLLLCRAIRRVAARIKADARLAKR